MINQNEWACKPDSVSPKGWQSFNWTDCCQPALTNTRQATYPLDFDRAG